MAQHENVFEKLESNDKQVVENIKYSIRDQFSKVNESWLINGLYDYYLTSNSVRCMEILFTLREPHQQFLFDRLCDSIKNSKTELKTKVQALTLLGHIARNQPTWLYKLPEHLLFKEILKFLINDSELLPLISALLVLIVLLPMFPSYIGEHYLEDIFDIFRRLAAWNCVSGKIVEDQMIHLQVALYALFLRLYGMYPCNFLSYLRTHFKDRNNPVFVHTIKPMMDTVKMHPSLVTTSKENETTTERWKKMGVHDVIVECERFSLDITDRCPHETCQNTTEFRSRSGTMNSTVGGESSYHQQNLKGLASLQMTGTDGGFFTPSNYYHLQTPSITETMGSSLSHRHIQGVANRTNYPSQEGSPPEAAIEATPETTPIRDFNVTPVIPLTSKTNVARALNSFRSNSGGYVIGTPTNSVPSSPMRKEPSPFTFPTSVASVPDYNRAVSSATDNVRGTVLAFGISGDHSRTVPSVSSTSAFARSSGVALSHQVAYRLTQERQQTQSSDTLTGSKPSPSSPLRIINPDTSSRQSNYQRMESPVSQEDEEVSSIVSKPDTETKKIPVRPCDSVLPDFDDCENKDGDDLEHGSPCTAGGLHMPNSKSINNFKKRIRRFRYHSQCNPEPEQIELSTGSSPGNGVSYMNNSTVRRANSCPDMKKSPLAPLKDNKRKPFYETDEETVSEDQAESVSNTSNGIDGKEHKQKLPSMSTHTQTDIFWPMPYEHLFLNIFPSLEAADVKPSPAPSPAPLNQALERYQPSLYDILDRYVEKSVCTADNNQLKDQLQLLHQQLLFERHRRETHAYRNRRLLSDAKSTRLLEEYNSALRDQVQLEQKEIDDIRMQLEDYRNQVTDDAKKLNNTIQYLEENCNKLQEENLLLIETQQKLEYDIVNYKSQYQSIDKERQQAEAALLDAVAEVNVAREQASVGEKIKNELQLANRELLLMGELHFKYRERLDKLPAQRQCEEEIKQVKETYTEESKALRHLLEAKTASIEAYRMRIVELEHQALAKDEIIATQKRTLGAVNEGQEALLEAVESKYQTQLSINRVLEEKMLELLQRVDLDSMKRNVHSPDTSSCHEVQVTTAAGLSPHSSPLSASFASSEGSAAFQDREVKNLQVLVDQPDGSSKVKDSDDGQLGQSRKND